MIISDLEYFQLFSPMPNGVTGGVALNISFDIAGDTLTVKQGEKELFKTVLSEVPSEFTLFSKEIPGLEFTLKTTNSNGVVSTLSTMLVS